ncbi:hypothetical protein GOODEAATRI_001874 [Goodea atripinnis]|uniref:Bridge-like lipid transfer protein family member 1 N-terminal domain-containing protein n=1 Tax=Goodea atripinnis TaxID=208336 RepID=A0ABV0P0N0_9TELE
MFSAQGLPLSSDTLEYAWLIDMQAGGLTGRPTCLPGHCRTSEELKYTMTRLAMDGVDLFVVEHGCAANVKVIGTKHIAVVANCNLHNQAVGEGISAVVRDVNIRQYIEQQQLIEAARLQLAGQGQGPGQPPLLRRSVWLEAGSVNLNLITADIALAADHPAKCEVQRKVSNQHLQSETMCQFHHCFMSLLPLRLWFLWPDDASVRNKRSRNRCGCLGGCRFFGGTNMGLDFFRLEELTPSSSSAFSSSSTESDMCYGQSLLQPGECLSAPTAPPLPLRKTAPPVPPYLCWLQSGTLPHQATRSTPSLSTAEATLIRSPLCSPLKRQSSVHSGRLGSTKSLSAAVFTDKPPPVLSGGVQFSSEVSRSDENVLDSPRQRRSYGSFPFTPSADSNTFHQYRSANSSMSVAESEAYFSATEDFEPISSADEGPGTYPGRKKKRRQQMQQPQQPPYHMENYRSEM